MHNCANLPIVINNSKAADLPMVPFGSQSYSKFQYFIFFCQKLEIETVCFENPTSNHNNYYS